MGRKPVSATAMFSSSISQCLKETWHKPGSLEGENSYRMKSSYMGSATSSWCCLYLVFSFLESPVNSAKLWLICIISVFVEEESDAVQITANQELSPFHVMISRRHRLSRTYSRKKLLS